MATINGLYVFVESEDVSYGVELTEHTVETGIAISDHVKKKAITVSIAGEIVGENASSVLGKLRELHQKGAVCTYAGRVTLSNCLIADFSIATSHEIWGGYSFSMTLKQLRTAKTSYKAVKTKDTKNTGTQQKTPASSTTYVYHTVKKGDTVWALVAASKAPYKSLSRPAINGKSYSACDWVMAKNQSAFSRKGDFGTLQIGKKIIVGVRNGTATTTPTNNDSSTKKYIVSVQITGTASYVGSVIITYTLNGKSANKTIKARTGAFAIAADPGTMVQVVATAASTCKFAYQKFNGSSWTSISDARKRIQKITKDSSTTIYFYKSK